MILVETTEYEAFRSLTRMRCPTLVLTTTLRSFFVKGLGTPEIMKYLGLKMFSPASSAHREVDREFCTRG